MEKQSAVSRHAVKLYMVMNYTSSILIVFLNKWAYNYGFPSITLTVIHFIVTAIGLKICAMAGMFQPKRTSLLSVLPLSLSFCGFVVLTNLSLTYNTVGFYQLAKVMTTPIIVFVQYMFYGITFSRKILISLLAICVGVASATKADLTVNSIGLTYAVLGVIVTAQYQIWVKTKQQELELSAFQLLYYQAPLSAAILCFLIPIFEPVFSGNGLLARDWPPEAMFAAIASALMAFAVNLSIFLVIGKTSPIAYNVLGHFKLCTVLAGGFIVFKDNLNFEQGVGIIITLVGIFAYTHFKMQETSSPTVVVLPKTLTSLAPQAGVNESEKQ